MKAEQSPQTELKEGTPQLEFGQSYINIPNEDKSSPLLNMQQSEHTTECDSTLYLISDTWMQIQHF